MPLVTVLRRFGLWLVICAVSAGPSFVFAFNMNASPAGMIAAVLLFAVLYTLVTCTPWFARFHARPFVRETLYVGYGLRLAMSLLAAFSAVRAGPTFGFVLMPDLFGGIISVGLAGKLLGDSGDSVVESFAGAFLATCVQGAIQNAVVFIVMAIAYGLQRAFRRPQNFEQRGFAVVPITQALTDSGAAAATTPRPDAGR